MLKDRFVRFMLVIIALLLCLNLLNVKLGKVIFPKAMADNGVQEINFGSRQGSSIACSSDGKYVFATDASSIFRSTDYGKKGTWEEVAR